ncbi:class I SAM-dependent methyltransferase [Tautonia marina]|uniref:class I SAM-dependent methyltransferase n=1 Tax=Tautonia marina TaxID=2653855 RepID=UPI0012605231|nr:class I SAM-dependent methyltransferase [Tautonia marina]
MKRRHLVELEDLPWWPRVFRDAATDYLVAAIRRARVYDGLAPRLADAIKRSGAEQVVDLCSGGGGPWPDLLPALRAAGVDVPVCLTDKYPNVDAFNRLAATTPGVRFEGESISATGVPPRLAGFRTVFTALHHFRPAEARAILAAAVRDRQGIAIAEALSRSWGTLAVQALVPLAVWALTPSIRPFRWSRLFWTYLLPVIPVAILFDGVVSTLRIYTPEEMLAMGRAVGGDGYEWEVGFERPAGSPVPIPYLIGMPARGASGTQATDQAGPSHGFR